MDRAIDLNCDLGESFGVYTLGHDELVMPHITSASLACGFHAGDPVVMRRSVQLAARYGVAVGAHPGLPDLAGFGRRELSTSAREVENIVAYQVGALAGVAATEGLRLQHVKLHGALYHMAARDQTLAEAVARAVKAVDAALMLFAPAGSRLVDAAVTHGIPTAAEIFADRAYDASGNLVPRAQAEAVIHDTEVVVARAVQMVRDDVVTAIDGAAVVLRGDTMCVHGDTIGAASLAAALRAGLEAAGVRVVSFEGRRESVSERYTAR